MFYSTSDDSQANSNSTHEKNLNVEFVDSAKFNPIAERKVC